MMNCPMSETRHIIGYLGTRVMISLWRLHAAISTKNAAPNGICSVCSEKNSCWGNPAICQKLISACILCSTTCQIYTVTLVHVSMWLCSYLTVIYSSPAYLCLDTLTCAQLQNDFTFLLWSAESEQSSSWNVMTAFESKIGEIWQRVGLWFRVWNILLNITLWMVYSQK